MLPFSSFFLPSEGAAFSLMIHRTPTISIMRSRAHTHHRKWHELFLHPRVRLKRATYVHFPGNHGFERKSHFIVVTKFILCMMKPGGRKCFCWPRELKDVKAPKESNGRYDSQCLPTAIGEERIQLWSTTDLRCSEEFRGGGIRSRRQVHSQRTSCKSSGEASSGFFQPLEGWHGGWKSSKRDLAGV